jgi:hypothetical protein
MGEAKATVRPEEALGATRVVGTRKRGGEEGKQVEGKAVVEAGSVVAAAALGNCLPSRSEER